MARAFRELIAKKVTESWTTIPHFFVTRELHMDALEARLARERSEATDVRVTATDLLVEALGVAVRDRIESASVDVGVAVASESGVMIPVLRDVLGADLRSLARQREAAVDRSRRGRLTPQDLDEPPFTTLSNLGPYGVDAFTGVIPLGQSTLLTVGRIAPRVVPDENGTPVVRRVMTATLNVDHRVLDGAEAAEIMGAFAEALDHGGVATTERA